ncbi:hypothetical protein [Lysinibacillus sp. fls2-241-R2A-57]|uniref:hypothetical protein n=1 Tax=Lysinibacillus sp. fls2-241-R2A-57 TaxID=3040292 RepID=UPI0025540ED1|nr:hypothetical protein [Lysinibacillus sp. fls2-241-R2A-57]
MFYLCESEAAATKRVAWKGNQPSFCRRANSIVTIIFQQHKRKQPNTVLPFVV